MANPLDSELELIPFADRDEKGWLESVTVSSTDKERLLAELRRRLTVWRANLKPSREQLLQVTHQENRIHAKLDGGSAQFWEGLDADWRRKQKPVDWQPTEEWSPKARDWLDMERRLARVYNNEKEASDAYVASQRPPFSAPSEAQPSRDRIIQMRMVGLRPDLEDVENVLRDDVEYRRALREKAETIQAEFQESSPSVKKPETSKEAERTQPPDHNNPQTERPRSATTGKFLTKSQARRRRKLDGPTKSNAEIVEPTQDVPNANTSATRREPLISPLKTDHTNGFLNLSRKEFAALIAGAATVGGLIFGLITSALQIAGVIDVAVAHWLIFLTWIVAVAAVAVLLFLWDRLSTVNLLLRIVVLLVTSILTGVGLLLIDTWMVNKRAEQQGTQLSSAIPNENRSIQRVEPSPSAVVSSPPFSSAPSPTPSASDQTLHTPVTSSQSPRICMRYEESKSAFDGRITVATGAISFEGNPLRHFVTFTVTSSGYKAVRYIRKENGDKIIYKAGRSFEVVVLSIDAINTCFDIYQLP